MIKYAVRSRQLIDVVGDIRRNKIILSPYFQRNIVWRTVHKQDFIKTILLGYPFPQIFLAKGGINVDDLTSISLVVDGQQRMKSIIEFVDNKISVDEKYFNTLTTEERDSFLTYEIAIIELQMESEDPNIKEIFKRLNRTFYSLTNIEKLATEYAPTEMMLIAKLLTKEIELKIPKPEHFLDPNIPDSFITWAIKKKVDFFNKLILESPIFTSYEISRKVHLMITLNILATIERGFFNRNTPASMLEEYSESFPEKDHVIEILEKIAKKIFDLNLRKDSYWYNKSNMFSLIIFFYNYFETIMVIENSTIKSKLTSFEENIPSDYQLAAKEAVNNKKERIIRHKALEQLLLN